MTGPRASFGERLAAAVAAHGPLCVGIDPHPALLAEWGLADDARGLERFALTCVDALAGHVAVVKPQSAFFERHGSRGIAVLEKVLAGLAAQAFPDRPRRCRCSTSSAATSARPWTATPTPTWPSAHRSGPTPSRSRPTSGSAR